MKEISFSSTKMSSIFAPIYSSHQSLIFRRRCKFFGEKTHVASKNIRYIRLCSLVLTIKHAVRFSTGGKDSHRLISAQFALLAFELFATRARRFFIVAVEKESREQQRRGKEKNNEGEEEEEAFFSFLRAHFYCLKSLAFISTPPRARVRARWRTKDGMKMRKGGGSTHER